MEAWWCCQSEVRPYLVLFYRDELVEGLHLDEHREKVGTQRLEEVLLEQLARVAILASALLEELHVEVQVRQLGLPVLSLAGSGGRRT